MSLGQSITPDRVRGIIAGLPDAFPEAFALRCLPPIGGRYDVRVDRILWRAGYRRTGGPFHPVFYRGIRPRGVPDPSGAEGIALVRRLASLVQEEPDPEYLKLFDD